MSLNRVFLGSPGTGKTTVAKLYGQILTELGLLNNVVIKNPSHFVKAYLGHSEKNIKAILDSTMRNAIPDMAGNDINLVFQAYMLYSGKSSGSQDQFKMTVINTMVAEIQSVPGEDRCILILGYKEQMEDMFQYFTEPQLPEVLDSKLKGEDLVATDMTKQVASDLLNRAKDRPNFGNAGEVENIL
ncbi:hypothetical protein M405DRAFT_848236, partial [Rhizopogon salebrosus TDB-379]